MPHHPRRGRSARGGPRTLVPGDMAQMGVRVCHTLEEGIRDADVVIMLRLQNERMSGRAAAVSQEYFKSFGLTQEKLQLAKPDAIVMHPGPINRAWRSTPLWSMASKA